MKGKTERSARISLGPSSPDVAAHPASSTDVPLIAIGASTGGPNALVTVLNGIPRDLRAAIVISQHITADFATGLASWLAEMTRRSVRIARNHDAPQAGEVLLAGTNDHLAMISGGTFRYTPDPADTPYRPSVDVLFSSLANCWTKPGVAVLLTGMGRDGAKGMLTLKGKGWHTIAQDESTSVVYGMPAAAAENGSARQILPLRDIGDAIARQINHFAVQ
jgi:chemotaxis response regulator CheB